MTNGTDRKLCKIYIQASSSDVGDLVGGESVWAFDLGDNKAEINNIPFFIDRCSLYDIVRYEVVDGVKEFREVLEKKTEIFGILWSPTGQNDSSKILEDWKRIAAHMKNNNVHYESAMAGAFAVALPIDKTEEENKRWIKALSYSSPIPLRPCFLESDD